jgi:hypothetical protein
VPSLFLCEDPKLRAPARLALQRLPALCGQPIRIQSRRGLRDRQVAVHAGSFPRERRIVFDCARREFRRIFTHEVFHFVWLRLGNAARRSYEDLIRRECLAGAAGELGWSAEWRKEKLGRRDMGTRARRWREYCCESFCDSAAWLYSGVRRHNEYTLAARFGARRRAWFAEVLGDGPLPV